MFTGIIEKAVRVKQTTVQGKGRVVTVEKPSTWKLKNGQSIAIDGICSTIINSTATSFTVTFMPETLKKTTAGTLTKGSNVNLERPLKLSDLLDGHLIQGHIDARGVVKEIKKQGTSTLISIQVPQPYAKQITLHGSVAINGVSLTVARMRGNTCTVALIPYTLSHTNLSLLKKGSIVNVETDFLARQLVGKKRATVGRNATRRVSKKA